MRLSYNLYSVNDVFQDKSVNVICNKLMQGVTDQEFPDVNEHFALTGDCAVCLGINSTGPVKNIQFATDDAAIFIYLANNLKKICPEFTRVEKYETRLIAYFSGAVLEIYRRNNINTRSVNGIYITTWALS